MRNVCYARTHAGRQAQARAHTHCCEIIRALGSRERKRETRRRAAAPPILKREREAASGARAGRGNNCGTEEILHCRSAAVCRHRNFVRVKQNVIVGKRQQLPTCELRGTVSPGKDAWQRTDRFVLLCAWDQGLWRALSPLLNYTLARWLNMLCVCLRALTCHCVERFSADWGP